MRCLFPAVVIVCVIAGASSAPAAMVIGGTQYVPVLPAPNESFTAPFQNPGGGGSAFSTATSQMYHGLVELAISGIGQSFSTAYNDAFYLFTYIWGGDSIPANGGLFGPYYQLAVDTQPIQGNILSPTPSSQLATSKIFYDIDANLEVAGRPYVPQYRADHTYSVVVDVGSNPNNLYFTVADGNYADDTGAYQIQVTQLSAATSSSAMPEPATLIIWSFLGVITVSCGLWRRARRMPSVTA